MSSTTAVNPAPKELIGNELLSKVGILILRSYSQFAQALDRHIVLKPFTVHRYGQSFVVSGNFEYFLFWRYASWEQETFQAMLRVLDRDHSFIDIGSWIGPTVLFGACLAKKAYGIEPDPLAFNELEKNVRLNGELQEKISLHQLCIHDTSGEVRFGSPTKGGDTISSIRFGDAKTSWVVPSRTFQQFIDDQGINDCNFIKMDIEGSEANVLPTMKRYLEEAHPVLHLSMHPPFFPNPMEDTKKILDALASYPFLFCNGTPIKPADMLSKSFLQRRYTLLATTAPLTP